MTREERLDWLCRLRSEIYVYMPYEWLKPMDEALTDSIKTLEQEPKTGHWVENEKQTHVEKIYHCSECGFEAWGECEHTNYCGGCGARMSEVEQ